MFCDWNQTSKTTGRVLHHIRLIYWVSKVEYHWFTDNGTDSLLLFSI